jgi:hypothetical protein
VRHRTIAIVIDLPAAPVAGDFLNVIRDGTNAVTLDRNGDDLTRDADMTLVRLTYVGTTWHIERARIV